MPAPRRSRRCSKQRSTTGVVNWSRALLWTTGRPTPVALSRSWSTCLRRRATPPTTRALLDKAVTQPLALTGAPVGLLTGLRRWSAPLIQRLLVSEDPDLRAIGVRASTCLPNTDGPVRFLTDPDPRVRLAALELPGGSRAGPGLPQRALTVLDDPSPLVRRAAVTQIAFCGRPEAGAALLQRLAIEPDRVVRKVILLHLAATIRSAGISAAPAGSKS